MYRYRCVFNFSRIYEVASRSHEVTCSDDGIYNFADGFWINEELKFTKGSDCKYWIPPSQILYVVKEKGAEYDG